MHPKAKVKQRTVYHVSWNNDLGAYVATIGGSIIDVYIGGLSGKPMSLTTAVAYAKYAARSLWHSYRVPTQVFANGTRPGVGKRKGFRLEASYGCDSKARG